MTVSDYDKCPECGRKVTHGFDEEYEVMWCEYCGWGDEPEEEGSDE